MLTKIYNFWQILKGNLWFIPALFCFFFGGFTFALYYVEVHYLSEIELPEYFFKGTTDDAKAVVTTLLSAMITMATLAISITIVVLSLAASQLGPRLIKSFMSDRKTKDYIAFFFGTVIACFILTIILHSRTSEATTPQLTISAVFIICFINLFKLLGFVHHVAQSCIADNVILKVADNLKDALERLTRDAHPHEKEPEDICADDWPKDFDPISKRLFFERSGYVQNIDYEEIVKFAAEHGCRIQIRFKAGHFMVSGDDGVKVYTKSPLPEDYEQTLRDCFIIGNSRTPTQDIEYSIRHLVEIAIRALSPGINDAFTAMHVIDHLSSSLSILFEKKTASEFFYDNEGVLRLKAMQSGEDDIILNAFNQIRHSGGLMPDMIRHMLDKLITLSKLAESDRAKAALKEQLEALLHDLNKIDRYLKDRKELEKTIKQTMKELSN